MGRRLLILRRLAAAAAFLLAGCECCNLPDSPMDAQEKVKDEEAAFGAFGFIDGRIGPGQFRVIVASNAGVPIETCEKLMDEEIEKIKKEGITAEELAKVKTQFKAGFIDQRETVMNKAEELHHYIWYHNDLSVINTELDTYMKVTADDIKRVANQYLRTDNRTLVVAAPPKQS